MSVLWFCATLAALFVVGVAVGFATRRRPTARCAASATRRRLGKRAFAPDHRDLVFANYRAEERALPKHPAAFGHSSLVRDYRMLANDQIGDCAIAMIAHFFMLCAAETGAKIDVTDESVVKLYSDVTGYVPGDESTDEGTVVRDLLKYLRETGYTDAAGKVHRIEAFVRVDHTSLEQLQEACWLFGGVLMGFDLPQSADDQFDAGKAWSVVRGSPSLGGHAVPIFDFAPARRTGLTGSLLDKVLGPRTVATGVTWGERQPIEDDFIEAKADEAWVILAGDAFKNGRTIDGFDLASLKADLRAVAA